MVARDLQNNAVSVSTAVTNLCDGSPNRTLVTFTNNGAVTVYLGGSNVSSTAFIYPLPAGEWVQFTNDGGDAAPTGKWYGVTASSTASVAVGEAIR